MDDKGCSDFFFFFFLVSSSDTEGELKLSKKTRRGVERRERERKKKEGDMG